MKWVLLLTFEKRSQHLKKRKFDEIKVVLLDETWSSNRYSSKFLREAGNLDMNTGFLWEFEKNELQNI